MSHAHYKAERLSTSKCDNCVSDVGDSITKDGKEGRGRNVLSFLSLNFLCRFIMGIYIALRALSTFLPALLCRVESIKLKGFERFEQTDCEILCESKRKSGSFLLRGLRRFLNQALSMSLLWGALSPCMVRKFCQLFFSHLDLRNFESKREREGTSASTSLCSPFKRVQYNSLYS